jgi:hypothetical protein
LISESSLIGKTATLDDRGNVPRAVQDTYNDNSV